MAFLRLGDPETNWPYAVARVQAKRSKLIPEDQLAKLTRMDVGEITRFVEESAYRNEVDELANRFTGLDLLEAALTVNEERTYAGVRQLLDGEGRDLVGLFLMRYLVEDLKAVLRGKTAGAGRDELLKELLLEDLDTYNLFEPLIGDDVKGVEDIIQALERQGGLAARWSKVLAEVPSDAHLSHFEDALDRAYYHHLLTTAKESTQEGADLLHGFVRREIDHVNTRNAARWVAAGQTGDFSPYVLPGGYQLGVAQVVGLARSDDLDAFVDALRDVGLPEDVQTVLDEVRKTGRLSAFERALWRHHQRGLDRFAHAQPLSIVPILVFLVRKRREVLNVRAVARGRAAGLSDERLEELIL